MKSLTKVAQITGLAILLAVPLLQPAAVLAQTNHARLEAQVRHEIVMLPYLTVFDNIEFAVHGDKVVLSGQVVRPTLKTSAERVVKRIEGIALVENHIEVLPLSSADNGLRLMVYRAVYGFPSLNRYALPVIAPIRIIVKNGNVTLAGVVDSKTDKNLAGLLANGVPGIFSVTNHLHVTSQ